jgi:RimJ/RimL family protein N-acetyltransferase
MNLRVREMRPEEAVLVIEYFHSATPEYLELLGVDPTRLPSRQAWAERFQNLFSTPIERRHAYFVIWLLEERSIGFSMCDKISYGEQANMHLHVLSADYRQRGIGATCVRQSVKIYFEVLKIKTLFCEPNALNVGPNRTVQKAGFKYLKTHWTVPGPFNYHHAVTRWVIERGA